MSRKLLAASEADGRVIDGVLAAGQVSDYTDAAPFLVWLAKTEYCLADRGDDRLFTDFSLPSQVPPLSCSGDDDRTRP